VDWIIYYSDGSIFSSDDGSWEKAPSLGVQVILFRNLATKWEMRHSGDFFRLADDNSIVAMDEDGMKDHVVNVLGVVKQGRMHSKKAWDAVYQQAKQDMAALKVGD